MGDFNEDENANNFQEFMVEMGLYEVFSEIHWVNENNRHGTFEHGRSFIDCALVSEGMMNTVEGINPIEWNKIVDSDHRSYLIHLNLEMYFAEEFNNKQALN